MTNQLMQRYPLWLFLLACGATSTIESESATGSESAENVHAASHVETPPSDERQPASLSPQHVCGELHIEDAASCTFREGGQQLSDGARIDVLELTMDDMRETTVLVVVLRMVNDPDPMLMEVAEAYDVPGESASYEIGEFSVSDDTVSLPLTQIHTTYPNTGDPDEPTGEYSEREESVVRCVRDEELWECQQL